MMLLPTLIAVLLLLRHAMHAAELYAVRAERLRYAVAIDARYFFAAAR